MSIKFSNFIQKNENISILSQKGAFTVIQHNDDKSVTPATAVTKYFMAQMECCERQLFINCNNGVKVQAGAMQMIFGNVQSQTGVTGVGDMVGKFLKGKATGERGIKPEYRGNGWMITEPTYKHLILEDLADWGGSLACDDGMFYAADLSVQDTVQMRSNISSALAGGEGLFNCLMRGQGIVALESYYPREELYMIDLDNDVIKIDGNNAVCWSGGLEFTVERSSKSLLGSMANGEGLVNVYRGTGRILVAPMAAAASKTNNMDIVEKLQQKAMR